MFLIIFKLTLLASVVLSETYPKDEEMQTTEDKRFTAIEFVDGIFSYAEESVTQLVTNLETIVKHLDTCVQFTFDSFSYIVDLVIRLPAYIITNILYAVSWTIDSFVYLLLDLGYLYLIKDTFLYTKWNLIGLLYILTDFIYYTLHIFLYLFKIFVLTYLNIVISIFVYFITPFFQSVFWILSVVTVGYFTLLAVTVIWETIKQSPEGERGNNSIFLLFIPLACVVYSLWFSFCSSIFNFICYPIMILLYCFLAGFVTFYIGAELFVKFQHYIHNFDQDRLSQILRNVLENHILKVLGVDKDNGSKEGQGQSEIGDDSAYMDNECIVCFEEMQLVKLSPCKHKVMCYNCTLRILENDYRCPICRATIYSYQTDYGFD